MLAVLSPSQIPESRQYGDRLVMRLSKTQVKDFPGSSMVKNPPASAKDMGLILDLERSHMQLEKKLEQQ